MIIIRQILFYFIQFTWGVLQNLVGFIGFIVMKAKGAEQEKFHNSFITYVDAENFGGVSIGIFIFICSARTGERRHDIRIHEYGHTIQSAILGPIWPFVIALPSVIWCNFKPCVNYRKNKNVSYYWLYCEGWANLCGLWASKEKFVTKECLVHGRYGQPINPNFSKRKNIKGRKRKK